MGLWDQVLLPLLIGVASAAVFAALCFLGVRLWNCSLKQIKKKRAAVGELSPRPDANALPDMELGTVNGGEGALPDVELGTVNGGEGDESMALLDLDEGMANGGEGQVSRGAAASVGQMGSGNSRPEESHRVWLGTLDTARVWLGTFDTVRVWLGILEHAEDAAMA